MKFERSMPLLAFGLFLIGLVGTMVLRNHWLVAVFGHLGGLGIIGLLACIAAYIAQKKGYNHRKAFMICFVSSLGLGIAAVGIVHAMGGSGCGGIVSLAAGFLVMAFYGVLKKR